MKSIIYKCYKEYSGFSRCVHQIFVSREDNTLTDSEEEMQRDKEKYEKKKKKRTTLAEKKRIRRKSLEPIE